MRMLAEGAVERAPMPFECGARIDIARCAVLADDAFDGRVLGKEFIVPVIEIVLCYCIFSVGDGSSLALDSAGLGGASSRSRSGIGAS